MPESGYFAKRPRPQHRMFLTKYLEGRNNVLRTEVVDDFRLTVFRRRQADIRVYLTNQYTLGIADTMEILEAAPETTCIVSTMGYNQYTSDAKQYARERGVGLFKSSEFLGAVYYEGDRFLDYLPSAERERLDREASS